MSYIRLNSGGHFDFVHPMSSEFTIKDIALGLSRLNRFLGQTRVPYSVARHSVNVSYLVPPEQSLAGLLHDAAEAFLGDVPTPLKAALGNAFRDLEFRVEAAVFMRLGVTPYTPEIKYADLVLLATEREWLLDNDPGEDWPVLAGIKPLTDEDFSAGWNKFRIGGQDSPELAYQDFLERFAELTGANKHV